MSKVMLLAGLAKHIPYDPSYAYVGIDHGAVCAMEQGIPLCCAIGDFDSVTKQERARMEAYTTIETLPAHKDETDTEIAILYAMEHKYEEIILFGGIGGRLDHTLANLNLIIHRNLPITLMDEHHECKVLTQGRYVVEKRFRYLSFIALEPSCISEENVLYPLDKRSITPADIYPISNEILTKDAIITIHSGRVLMIQCEDAN